tara:strand:+ start:1835 stop:2542 length:708 start_codon:yes stop_codon:yes gene_type:complete
MKESNLRKTIRGYVREASARQKDSARKWKQGDDLNLYNSDYDDYIPEEIQDFMSAEEKEEHIQDDYSDEVNPGMTYTLEDIVDSKVLRTKSPAGALAWIDATMDLLKKMVTDDEFFETLMDLKENNFNDFAAARDAALDIWVPSASKILGQDASQLPELSDNSFLNGFLFDFWFMETFVKPLVRQQNKGKDMTTSLKSVGERWKYMTQPNRIKNFIQKVITPAFEFLTRDTSVAD